MQSFTLSERVIFYPGRFQLDKLNNPNATSTKKLSNKETALLLLLCSAKGEVVSRQDIISHIWPNLDAADSSLNRTILVVRRKLESLGVSEPIMTLPRVGYAIVDCRENKPEAMVVSPTNNDITNASDIADHIMKTVSDDTSLVTVVKPSVKVVAPLSRLTNKFSFVPFLLFSKTRPVFIVSAFIIIFLLGYFILQWEGEYHAIAHRVNKTDVYLLSSDNFDERKLSELNAFGEELDNIETISVSEYSIAIEWFDLSNGGHKFYYISPRGMKTNYIDQIKCMVKHMELQTSPSTSLFTLSDGRIMDDVHKNTATTKHVNIVASSYCQGHQDDVSELRLVITKLGIQQDSMVLNIQAAFQNLGGDKIFSASTNASMVRYNKLNNTGEFYLRHPSYVINSEQGIMNSPSAVLTLKGFIDVESALKFSMLTKDRYYIDFLGGMVLSL